jgi:hypothetical protein
MKPPIFLRIASVLTLIHSILHTIGGVFSKAEPGPAAVAYAAMQANQFLLMGHTRSYAIFYRGLGLGITIMLTVEAIVFWQLGALAKTHARQIRPIVATFVVGYLALTVNSWNYFFIGPEIVEILIAMCLVLAIYTAKPTAAV